jgi:hypothetical protein
MRKRAPFARALGVVAGQAQELESLGRRLSRSQRYMPHVSASLPNSFLRCAEPPRSPNRGRVAASRRGRSPAQLGQRAGGLRYSRLHSGVCSHTSHICWAARASQASRDEPGCTARGVCLCGQRGRTRRLCRRGSRHVRLFAEASGKQFIDMLGDIAAAAVADLGKCGKLAYLLVWLPRPRHSRVMSVLFMLGGWGGLGGPGGVPGVVARRRL